MRVHCWASVAAGGLTLKQHWCVVLGNKDVKLIVIIYVFGDIGFFLKKIYENTIMHITL